MKFILATHNLHKRDELLALAHGLCEIEILPDDFPEIPETGNTLQENASLKSQYVFNLLGHASFADDTGLEVAALGGAPGVFTARFAGENATYHENCRKLLHELEGKADRRAKFTTVISYTDESGNDHYFEGSVEGMITNEFRGTNGFGYDPIFEPLEGGGKTFAEMTSGQKNLLSHRARAMNKFLQFVGTLTSAEKGTD